MSEDKVTYSIASQPTPEAAHCPVHGLVGDKVMTMNTWDGEGHQVVRYGEVCALCYFDWILTSLPKITRP